MTPNLKCVPESDLFCSAIYVHFRGVCVIWSSVEEMHLFKSDVASQFFLWCPESCQFFSLVKQAVFLAFIQGPLTAFSGTSPGLSAGCLLNYTERPEGDLQGPPYSRPTWISKLSCLLETIWSLRFLFSTQRHFQTLAGLCFLYYDLKIPDRKWVHCSGPPYIVLVSWSALLFVAWLPNSWKQFSHTSTSLNQGATTTP